MILSSPLPPFDSASIGMLYGTLCTTTRDAVNRGSQMHYNTGGFDLFTYMKNPEVFNVVNGAIPLLTGPGLGIELNEDMIRAEAETVIREGIPPWQNPIFRGDDGAVREW